MASLEIVRPFVGVDLLPLDAEQTKLATAELSPEQQTADRRLEALRNGLLGSGAMVEVVVALSSQPTSAGSMELVKIGGAILAFGALAGVVKLSWDHMPKQFMDKKTPGHVMNEPLETASLLSLSTPSNRLAS